MNNIILFSVIFFTIGFLCGINIYMHAKKKYIETVKYKNNVINDLIEHNEELTNKIGN